MAYRTRVLVVANKTADSEGLAVLLAGRPDASDAAFTLLVPCTRQPNGREVAHSQLQAGLKRLRDAGLDVAGTVGDHDPIVAVAEAWKPGEFDEVLVSTLEGDASRWLEFDLPHRIQKLTDCQVQHVVPAQIERELARKRFRRPLHRPPQRSLGPFAGPAL